MAYHGEMEQDLVLGPYKEPLQKVEVGYGYFGAITLSKDGQSIQCHICGELRENLSMHLRQHKISVKDYREKFGLSAGTALVSEAMRQRLKEQMFALREKMIADGRAGELAEHLKKFQRARKGKKTGSRFLTPEQKNIRGVCPDQLIQLIRDAHEKYRRPFSYMEFETFHQTSRFYMPIRRTFGNWTKAVKKAGLDAKGYEKNKGSAIKYSDEELLDFLSTFWLDTGKIPSATDCKRGLLPTAETYMRRFGTMDEARRRAGIDPLTRGGSHKPEGVISVTK